MTGDEEYLVCDLEMSNDNLPSGVTKIEVAERFRFYRRKQKVDETIADFVAALWDLSKDCQFGSFLNSALRDTFVIGLVDPKIQEKLLTKSTLTLGTAVKVATSMEAPTQKSKQLRPIHQVRSHCWRCDEVKPDHCLFQNMECFRCIKLGKQASKCTQTEIKAILKVSTKENIETSKPSSKPLKNTAKMPTKPGEESLNLKSLCSQIKPVQIKEILSLLKKKQKTKSCLLVENSSKVEKISQGTSTSKPEAASSNKKSPCNKIKLVHHSKKTLSSLKKIKKKTKSCLLVENSSKVEKLSQGTSTSKPEAASSNMKSPCNQTKPVSTEGILSSLKKIKKKPKSCLLVENSRKVEKKFQGTSTSKQKAASSNLESSCNQIIPVPTKETLSPLKKKKKKNKRKKTKSILVENSCKVEKISQGTSTSKPEAASSNLESAYKQIIPVPSKETLSPLKKKKKKKKKPKSCLLVENSCEVETILSQGTSTNNTTDTETDICFDCIDPNLCYSISSSELSTQNKAKGTSKKYTEILALDCEMVGVGVKGSRSVLARVSIVNQFGECIYDKYVDPGTKVTDYRTRFSGIRPHNLENAFDSMTVCQEVAAILRGRILVGHGLNHDLDVLKLQHPNSNIRDTSQYRVFQAIVNGAKPSLKKLAHHFLGIEIQSGEHSSIQDAQAAMRLYQMFRQQWETDLTMIKKKRNKKAGNGEKISNQTSKPAQNTTDLPIS